MLDKSEQKITLDIINSIDENILYDLVDAAKLLGLTKQSLYMWIRTNKIGYVQIGRRYKIPGKDLLKKVKYVNFE